MSKMRFDSLRRSKGIKKEWLFHSIEHKSYEENMNEYQSEYISMKIDEIEPVSNSIEPIRNEIDLKNIDLCDTCKGKLLAELTKAFWGSRNKG